jgi:outer membrane protein OmpA-like peptidoglycan-associated protein
MRNLIAAALMCATLAGCAGKGEDIGVRQERSPPEVFSFDGNGNGLVFFDSGSTRLGRGAIEVLDALNPAGWSKDVGRVEIVGHADRTGSATSNLRLSLRRAETVRDALVARGAPESLFVVSGAGEDDPLVPTADGVAEPQNRYVTITPRALKQESPASSL